MSKTAVLALLVGLICLPTAQASPDVYEDEALLWGHACVAEISLSLRLQVPEKKRMQQKIEECRLMWSIQLEKAERKGTTPVDQVTTYNTLFKRRNSSRRYVLRLNADGSEPEGWPSHAKWEQYKDIWMAIYEEAKRFSESPGDHPCPEADEYGGRCDNNEHACDAPASCYKRVLCGRPIDWWSQAYYSVDYRECKTGATIPADVAAGGYRTQARR